MTPFFTQSEATSAISPANETIGRSVRPHTNLSTTSTPPASERQSPNQGDRPTSRRRHGLRAVVVAAAVAVLAVSLAACGSDGEDKTQATVTSMAPNPDAGEFCQLMKEMGSLKLTKEGRELGFSDEELKVLEEIRAAAPAEIREDISVSLDNAIEAFQIYQDDGGNQEAIQQMVARINAPESVAAEEHIAQYVADTCGFDTLTGKDIPMGPQTQTSLSQPAVPSPSATGPNN